MMSLHFTFFAIFCQLVWEMKINFHNAEIYFEQEKLNPVFFCLRPNQQNIWKPQYQYRRNGFVSIKSSSSDLSPILQISNI